MKLAIQTLAGQEAGSVEVSAEVFGLEPRTDLIARMVRYQLAKRQQGTHQAQERSTINRTTKKMYKQKGTGGARHGSAKAPQFRGGGRAFGPISRSHAHDLPKKVRVLALKHALSAKAKDANIIVLDKAEIAEPKTKLLLETLAKLGWSNTLIIGGETLQDNFVLAARNIPNLDVLPVQGINVYDIIRREKLVLTTAALDAINARLAG
ncbi:MAG: 50S ribosomal protein L4 [Methylobacterium sp.]|jgi:large subunit ribosomal protein L4|nr:50S ribosomal protein L4 [Methylobacterium sp.]MCA3597789.1 50S ribosomal protein L4 [Methylobacterium sp.]MCA3599443.1 50S ribosomal protein L4 [Methylobacterium sp.]MCA3604260.1 50S ribosomal protein L4 [Methylobacterium sp.]MCA3607098.1 50S ribosomal protein L4 [Methylobacterium sp.]